MKETCNNHPEKESQSFCHSCGRHFCSECLTSSAEYYYCKDSSCQFMMHKYELELKAQSILKKKNITKRSSVSINAISYAGFLRRLVALVLDLIFIFPLFIIIALYAPESIIKSEFSNLIFPFVFWLYYVVMEGSAKHATLGKMIMGIVVTDLNGEGVSFEEAAARNLFKIVSKLTFGIGYLMVLFTIRSQALHDKMAKCLVIKKRKKSI